MCGLLQGIKYGLNLVKTFAAFFKLSMAYSMIKDKNVMFLFYHNLVTNCKMPPHGGALKLFLF